MRTWVVGLALAIAAGAFLAVSISDGMDYGQRDAPTYVSSAEVLARGDGFRTDFGDPGKPLQYEVAGADVVDFPPGYPLVLSVPIKLGLDTDTVVPGFSVLALAAMTLLVFLLARRRGLGIGGSALAASVAAVLTLPEGLAPQSEPLYGLLMVGSIVLITRWLSAGGRWSLFASVGLAMGAVLVRTVGLALVGALMVVVWLGVDRGWRRWASSLVVGAFGVLPFLLTTAEGNRHLAWHPLELKDYKEAAVAVADWFVPPVGPPVLRFALFGLLVAGVGLWLFSRRRSRGPGRQMFDRRAPWLPGLLSAFGHLALLVATITFLDSQTSLTTRLLYPVAMSLLVCGVELAAVSKDSALRASRILAVLASAAFLAGLWTSVAESVAVYSGERNLASPELLESETMEVIGGLEGDYDMYSNIPDGLWVAGVPFAYAVPAVVDPLSDLPNSQLDSERELLRSRIEDQRGVVYFYEDNERPYLMDRVDLEALAPCVVLDDGVGVILVSESHPLCPLGPDH